MKIWQYILMALIFMATLGGALPSWADPPSFAKNPEYVEVTQALDYLKKVQDSPTLAKSYTPEEIQNQIDLLEFQKYALETGINWSQCRNETGKTLAVYGVQPELEEEDYNSSYDTGLYFLADGQTTQKQWDCQGVYLPSDATTHFTVNGQDRDFQGAVAIKIPHGTNLVVSTNPDTGAVEFNVPATKVYKAGEINWFIPNVPQELIDTRVPDAPTGEVASAD